MSAIKDGRMPIELNGKQYKMLFSLNVMDELEDKIGSLDGLTEAMNGKGRMKIIKWLFTLLLNEGADDNAEPLTEQQVGKMIHNGNISEIQTAIYKAFTYGNRGTTDPPPATDDSGDEAEEDEAGKNGQPGEGV